MSRRHQATRRTVPKDAKFNSQLVSRLVNTVMISGNKSVAQRIVYGAFDQLVAKNPASNPLEVLQRAVDNAKPRLEVKARRVGGAPFGAQRTSDFAFPPRADQDARSHTRAVAHEPGRPTAGPHGEAAQRFDSTAPVR